MWLWELNNLLGIKQLACKCYLESNDYLWTGSIALKGKLFLDKSDFLVLDFLFISYWTMSNLENLIFFFFIYKDETFNNKNLCEQWKLLKLDHDLYSLNGSNYFHEKMFTFGSLFVQSIVKGHLLVHSEKCLIYS